MLALYQLAANLSAAEPVIWGETVRASSKQLQVFAVSAYKQQFVTGIGPDGIPWKPLAHNRPDGSNKVLRDKGKLQAAVQSSMTTQGELELTVSHPGANVHQYGATIKPTRGKMLAIPMSKEAKRVGSPRQNGFPRPLFVMQAVGQTAYLAEAKGKRGMIVVHYALVRQVTIPKRLIVGFSNETVDKMITYLLAEYEKRLVKAMEERQAAYFAANPIIG